MADLLYRVYGWDEQREEVWTEDNTQVTLETMRKHHVGFLNQKTADGSDVDRVYGGDNIVGLVSPSLGHVIWTPSSDSNLMNRLTVGTRFTVLEGMQFYTPHWREVFNYAVQDPDFPCASPVEQLGEIERELVRAHTQTERRRLAKIVRAYEDRLDELGRAVPSD